MKPKSRLEACFSLLEKCTSVEKDLIWMQSNCDPFAVILSSLERTETELPSCPPTCCCLRKRDMHEIASTSKSSSNNAFAEFLDVRVRYGHLLMLILRQVADELRDAGRGTADDSSLIPIKHSALISTAFQFFILTCVSPYLDEGVGIPLQLRSHVIRSWEKCKGDKDFQESQLSLASDCIAAVLNCHDYLYSHIIRKYCSDIVCVFEQLMMLGNEISPAYEQILNTAPPQILVCAFLSLLKPRYGTKPPNNYVLSIGSHLSKILMAKDGLLVTLASYEEINGEQLWQNFHFLSSIAKQFVLPPRSTKRMAYYRNITSQFIEAVKVGNLSRTKVSALFSMFAEELRKKCALAASIFIDDVLFKPWEMFSSSTHHSWTDDHSISLCLLRLWSDSMSSAPCLKSNPRFLPCVAILLSFLSISDCEKGTSLKYVIDDIFTVSKCALKHVENLSDFFLTFISDPSPCFELSQQPALIQAVEERPLVYGKVFLSRLVLNGDQLLARRIDSTIAFLKSLERPLCSQLLIEIACKSVENWSIEEGLDVPRFISNPETTRMLPRSSWHFVAGIFFEQMNDSDIDCKEKATVLSLLKLIQEILRSTLLHLQRRQETLSCLDVVVTDAEANYLHKTIIQNAKMAVGLAGAVIMTACTDEQIASALSETCAVLASLSNFVSSSKCSDKEITVLAADARGLATLFEKDFVPVEHVMSEKKEASVNPVDNIRERLAQDSPVDRGGALLDAGRFIRLRNATILLQLEEWLFDAMKDALYDPDSYVYLAAINALAEASCYNSKYLREMTSLFKNFDVSKISTEIKVTDKGAAEFANNDSVRVDVVIRSRLCEVIGKVFRELGDMGPVWMDECAGVFLACLSESDEILRAGALQSLAELILACRGRNLAKYLGEIFLIVEQLLVSESSILVRRSAVNLLRQTVKSCDAKIFEVVDSRLRDLHRRLLHLWRFDPDHTVRLHAELALEEMKVAVKNTVLQETFGARNIAL